MPIGDPLVKGTTTKDNIPLLEVKVSHFAKIADSRVRVSARRRVRVRVFCEISVTTRLQVEKLIGTRRVLRRRAQIRSQILCAVNIHASATGQREHGFLLDQPYGLTDLDARAYL